MRLFRLLQLAAQAETLRWKRTGRGYAIQAGFGAGAAVFGLMMLVMLHLAAMAWLAETSLGPVGAALSWPPSTSCSRGCSASWRRAAASTPWRWRPSACATTRSGRSGDQTARAAVILPMMRSRSIKKGLFGAAATALLVGLIARRR
jgi:hypothetical protein